MWNRLVIMNSEFIMISLSGWNVLQMLFIFLFRLFDSRTPKKLLGLGEVSNKRKTINISEWRKNEEKFQGSIFPFQRRELKNGSILMGQAFVNITYRSCHAMPSRLKWCNVSESCNIASMCIGRISQNKLVFGLLSLKISWHCAVINVFWCAYCVIEQISYEIDGFGDTASDKNWQVT